MRMFNTRPPPPSGRPPPYMFVNRMYKRNLRPVVILFGTVGAIWALVWAGSAFRDIGYDRAHLPSYTTFDIVLGVLFSVLAFVELYGIFAAFTNKIPLVRIYAYLSFVGVLLVFAIEILRLVLHFTMKKQLIDACINVLQGEQGTTLSGNPFSPDVSHHIITLAEAQKECNRLWSRDTFSTIAWLLVATLLGIFFAAVNFAYYRQLLDPNSARTMAPSDAYQMNATRNAYGYNQGGIPGYNPYQTQTYGDYVPPYDPAKPPGYTSGGYDRPSTDDEKVGYGGYPGPTTRVEGAEGRNPFEDSNRVEGGFVPPAGPPPGLGLGASNPNPSRDEGFDPAAVAAALRASEADQKANAPAPAPAGGAGPSTR